MDFFWGTRLTFHRNWFLVPTCENDRKACIKAAKMQVLGELCLYLLLVSGDDAETPHQTGVPHSRCPVERAARNEAAVEVELAVGDLLIVSGKHSYSPKMACVRQNLLFTLVRKKVGQDCSHSTYSLVLVSHSAIVPSKEPVRRVVPTLLKCSTTTSPV